TACGENPSAAKAAGINISRIRWTGVLLSGFLSGIGGFALMLAVGGFFYFSVAGYGFIALAVMFMGRRKPLPILGFALLIALVKVIGGNAVQIPFLPSFAKIKFGSWIYNILPYIVVLILLPLTSKRRRTGQPYDNPFPRGPYKTGEPLVEWPQPKGYLYDKLLR
ncbi:MAG: hypothetical protein FWE69_06860, partial [Clostridiales bacterium]|nr:hypothetical protein [Clostridiales bacterium]